MVQAGAFDSLHDNRAQLFAHLEPAIAYGQGRQEQSGRGQSNLFDAGGMTVQARPGLRPVERWSEVEQLQREKSVLGFYVSGHPLLRYTDEIEGFGSAVLGSPETVKPNSTLRVFGIVSELKKKIDKRGNTMAFVTLEDFTGKADCIVFSDPYQKFARLLEPGSIVMVVGKSDGSPEQIKIIVNEVVAIEDVRTKFTKNVLVTLRDDTATPDTVRALASVLEQHPGKCPCYLNLAGGRTNGKSLYLARKFTVNPDPRFTDAIRRLLGPGSVRLQG
jgi:DNA polymerase-3 subunit alpha